MGFREVDDKTDDKNSCGSIQSISSVVDWLTYQGELKAGIRHAAQDARAHHIGFEVLLDLHSDLTLNLHALLRECTQRWPLPEPLNQTTFLVAQLVQSSALVADMALDGFIVKAALCARQDMEIALRLAISKRSGSAMIGRLSQIGERMLEHLGKPFDLLYGDLCKLSHLSDWSHTHSTTYRVQTPFNSASPCPWPLPDKAASESVIEMHAWSLHAAGRAFGSLVHDAGILPGSTMDSIEKQWDAIGEGLANQSWIVDPGTYASPE